MIEDNNLLGQEPTPPTIYGATGARPPTMIERHVNNASPMLARQRSLAANQYDQPQLGFDYNGYPVASGYGQPVSYGATPGEFMPSQDQNPFVSPYESVGSPTDYAAHHNGGPAAPQETFARQNSQLARQPSIGVNGAPEYADLSRSTSVNSYQAQQYADIQRKLGSPTLGAVSEEPALPPPALVPGNASPPPTASAINTAQPHLPASLLAGGGAQPRPTAAQHQEAKRPDTVYSAVYDEEDAYGGTM
jgi:hypothetical protein